MHMIPALEKMISQPSSGSPPVAPAPPCNLPGIAELEASLTRLSELPAAEGQAAALALARSLTGKTAQARYAAFLKRVPARLALAARHQQGPKLARTIDDWQEATRLSASAGPLTLDAHMVAHEMAMKLVRLGQP